MKVHQYPGWSNGPSGCVAQEHHYRRERKQAEADQDGKFPGPHYFATARTTQAGPGILLTAVGALLLSRPVGLAFVFMRRAGRHSCG
jgi:hypothetical protein